MSAQIVLSTDPHTAGQHNADLEAARERLAKAKTYRDLSTILVIPTRGVIPARAVETWMGMVMPMNQKFLRMFMTGMEVGEAYQQAVEMILDHPELSKWKYMLTMEEDNLPPADGLLRLYESMDEGYHVVGGLYWTKGPEGQPMCYGDAEKPINFLPQIPEPNALTPCHGLGMGFTLWDLDVFREGKLGDKPWFKTVQEPGRLGTQDLYAFDKVRRAGYRVACDSRVRVGHLETSTGQVW